VAVVNETLARSYWRDGRAVGGRLRLGGGTRPWLQVVGVVADDRHNGVTGLVKGKFYVPYAQWPAATGGNVLRNAFVVVRATRDPIALAGPVRTAVRDLDATVPTANVRTMNDVVGTALATPRLTGFLLTAFAAIALTLAAVGLYGLLAFVVSRRTREIGIRLALGADRWQVMRLVLGQALLITIIGLAAGVAAAAGLARLMGQLLYDVTPADPWTYAAVVLVLLTVSLLASGLPVLGAASVNPRRALVSE